MNEKLELKDGSIWIKNQQEKIQVLEVLLEEGLHINSYLPGWVQLVQL